MLDNNDAQMARLAGEFLNRVELRGSEVPAFTQVKQWLMAKANNIPDEPPEVPPNKGRIKG